jgi:hypothetical protein
MFAIGLVLFVICFIVLRSDSRPAYVQKYGDTRTIDYVAGPGFLLGIGLMLASIAKLAFSALP